MEPAIQIEVRYPSGIITTISIPLFSAPATVPATVLEEDQFPQQMTIDFSPARLEDTVAEEQEEATPPEPVEDTPEGPPEDVAEPAKPDPLLAAFLDTYGQDVFDAASLWLDNKKGDSTIRSAVLQCILRPDQKARILEEYGITPLQLNQGLSRIKRLKDDPLYAPLVQIIPGISRLKSGKRERKTPPPPAPPTDDEQPASAHPPPELETSADYNFNGIVKNLKAARNKASSEQNHLAYEAFLDLLRQDDPLSPAAHDAVMEDLPTQKSIDIFEMLSNLLYCFAESANTIFHNVTTVRDSFQVSEEIAQVILSTVTAPTS